MSLLNLPSPNFLNKKNPHSPDFQKFRLTGLVAFSSIYIRLHPTSFPRDPLNNYDFDLHKTQKNTKILGKTVYKISAWSYHLFDMLRQNFPEQAFLMLPKTSANFQKKNSENTFEDHSFSRKLSLDVSQSLYKEYLQLISSFNW